MKITILALAAALLTTSCAGPAGANGRATMSDEQKLQANAFTGALFGALTTRVVNEVAGVKPAKASKVVAQK